jgi:hypothetical protein
MVAQKQGINAAPGLELTQRAYQLDTIEFSGGGIDEDHFGLRLDRRSETLTAIVGFNQAMPGRTQLAA